jgi:hypothetical protein
MRTKPKEFEDARSTSLPMALEDLEERCGLDVRGVLGDQPAQDDPAVRLGIVT